MWRGPDTGRIGEDGGPWRPCGEGKVRGQPSSGRAAVGQNGRETDVWGAPNASVWLGKPHQLAHASRVWGSMSCCFLCSFSFNFIGVEENVLHGHGMRHVWLRFYSFSDLKVISCGYSSSSVGGSLLEGEYW